LQGIAFDLSATEVEQTRQKREQQPQSPPFLERFLEALFCHSVKHSLQFGLDLLNGIKPASFQLQFHFWK
jgi:hypothetical protein